MSICLERIRQCALPDGALRVKGGEDPIWIQPYFANIAAMALLAGRSPSDRLLVDRWLHWYAAHLRADGSVNEYEGRLSNCETTGCYQDLNRTDSVDATAALYLCVVDRFFAGTSRPDAVVANAARRSLEAILKLVDAADGRTWAKRDYLAKYLQDNVEAYAGLVAAERLFARLGDATRAKLAMSARKRLGAKLLEYWRPEAARFAYVLFGTSNFHLSDPAKVLGTAGMANLVGSYAVNASDRRPWQWLNANFQPDSGNDSQAPVAYWYLAALHVGTASERADFRERTVQEGMSFQTENPYIQRPAMIVLALTEGTKWLSTIVDSK